MKRHLFAVLFIIACCPDFCSILHAQQRNSKTLSADSFMSLGGGLQATAARIRNGRPVTVAFLGGSITNMQGWRDRVGNYLQSTWPQSAFTLHNAGIPSLGSLPHSFRLQHDVFSKGRIDLLFIETAVNDRVNGTDSLVQQRALEGIIRHARHTNPRMDIVLMAFADENKMKIYRLGQTPAEVALLAKLAAYYQLPFINLAKEVTSRIDRGEFTWEDDFKDLHPAPFGHALYAATICRLLERCLRDSITVPRPGHKWPPAADGAAYARGKYVSPSGVHRTKGFQLIPEWTPADRVPTRPGFVKVPVLEGINPGDHCTLSFKGKAVGIAVLAGPDAGNIHYRVDNGPVQTVSLYTQWSAGLHLPWFLLLADDLRPGKHQLLITIAADKARNSGGHACRIVHFLVSR